VGPMDDAALVQAARSGDGSAWADIYDRYADKLHDHCHRILRDRDEAADALHDAFIAASAHLDQLRDPARLRPWLYSICRHEALRRVRRRDRVELTDQVDDMTGVEVDMDRGSRAEELHELVWSAAAGLNERDRALLDLNLRQGLEGQDLADAMGTSLNSSYVMLSRLRDQVERSLGALLIARLGREDCEELDALLQGWDGRFSPLLRKRVARHVDGCDICTERRAAAVSPLALLAAAPLVPAPSLLRERVLHGIRSGAEPQPISFTRDGFAAPGSAPAALRRRAWWAVAGAVLLLGAIGAAMAVSGDEDPTQLAAVGDSTTTESTSGPSSSSESSSTSTTTTTPGGTSPVEGSTTTTPGIAPPVTDPDGPSTTTTSTSTSTSTTSTTDPPVVTPPPPPPDTTPPSITSLSSQHPEIRVPGSGCTVTTSTITATITGATSAVLRWAGAPLSGSKTMGSSGTTWTAVLGPFSQAPSDLTLDYTVEARDAAGNTATRSGTIMVTPCPG
jgi:RNA polymerase sigma factor (sigma-70 family)